MTSIYKSERGFQAIRQRYEQFLERWPAANQKLRIPTSQGETFVIASGDPHAPPLLLFHGSASNSAMWMGDVAAWAAHFRVYAVDMIGEPGLSAPSRPALASDVYARWLNEVMDALSISSASLVGVSLGGWLALDFATRHPERVTSLVLLSPGGVGAQKFGILLKVMVLRMFGDWGKRKAREIILGRAPAAAPKGAQVFGEFIALIHEHFRPRMTKLPIFTDEALRRLTMPVLAILGGKDVLLDSAGTRRRLESDVRQVEILFFPEGRHFIPGQTMPILKFLQTSATRENANAAAGSGGTLR